MTDTEWMELLQQDSEKAMRGIMERTFTGRNSSKRTATIRTIISTEKR